MNTDVDGVLVLTAAQILYESVTGRDHSQGRDGLEAAHRSQSRFEPSVIGFDAVVRVLLEHVPSAGGDVLDDAWVDRRPVGRDLVGVGPWVSARVKNAREAAASRR
jgi:hypothetical protein